MKYIKCTSLEQAESINKMIMIILCELTDGDMIKWCDLIKSKTQDIWLIPIDNGERAELILTIPDLEIIEVEQTNYDFFEEPKPFPFK